MRIDFHRIPCTRCDARGTKGPGACHNCDGTGKVLTTDAQVALAAYRKLVNSLAVPVESVVVGQRVRIGSSRRHSNRVLGITADCQDVTLVFAHKQVALRRGSTVYRLPTDNELRTFAHAYRAGAFLEETTACR
jgi:RecJ-like exonuclease